MNLPPWFKMETRIGGYNAGWTIPMDDGQAFYLGRDTKGTKDFLKLRESEAYKVRCGRRHFEGLGVDFVVMTSADEV